MNRHFKILAISLVSIGLSGCLYDSYVSTELSTYKANNKSVSHIGQARFLFDDLGTLSLKGLLDIRIMPSKVYETALLIGENKNFPMTSDSIPLAMQKYGFVLPKKIANWKSNLAPEPNVKVLGYISSYIEKEALGQKIKIQVSTLSCSACHSGRVYNSLGQPTDSVWLGSPNTSIDYDSYLGKIYEGLKVAAADNKAFLKKIQSVYPDIDPLELATIKKFVMPSINKEIKKMAQMNRVLPFNNGGPGGTNGLGAFKRAARLLKNAYLFHSEEAGYVSIPDINYRPFRSSLLADGSYGQKGKARFRPINSEEAKSPEHLKSLAQLTAFFSYSAMGNTLQNVPANIPNVIEIFNDFLKDSTPQRFPGELNPDLALQGKTIFNMACATCHGQYEGDFKDVRLVSFPNKFISFDRIGSDNYRWYTLDKTVTDFANKQKEITDYVEKFSVQKGYSAPILSGLWATAPYMHNGSVPDLWSFMNPSLRPKVFKLGGHALDFQKMGITYPEGYQPFSVPSVYNTTEVGRSNAGHENQFKGLSVDQKRALLEYLKLL